ncbi:hypothetical protein FOQG_02652 [Fusarium oxysporum f. sp. raphani 54005]|uniref:Uncharacterized protein n=3 Tax=Fusarium oxysporum TaxID=5507 RepID=X0DT80_FUSOX|nr:hypothetical protein FOQG_02652 [Fusarium oxysporum f. sp. raphani 54005]EXM25895.1 hypothetical protein FOTG_07607 [Fusarium oxysporum f. sp. vasinfectum 25433]
MRHLSIRCFHTIPSLSGASGYSGHERLIILGYDEICKFYAAKLQCNPWLDLCLCCLICFLFSPYLPPYYPFSHCQPMICVYLGFVVNGCRRLRQCTSLDILKARFALFTDHKRVVRFRVLATVNSRMNPILCKRVLFLVFRYASASISMTMF